MNGLFEQFAKFGAARLAAMLAVTLTLVGFFGFVMFRMSQPAMSVLFADLSSQDVSAILKDLDARGIRYELRGDGQTVLVPKDDVPRLRLDLAGKGIPVSRDRRRALIYNPSHLLGVEAPMSLLAASRLDHSILTDDYRLRVDLVCRATRDIAAGEMLAIEGTRHAVPALDPGLMPAVADSDGSPLPYYMAVGRTVRRPVAKGARLRFGGVRVGVGSGIGAASVLQ